jgi:hypothetical protein
MGYTQPRTHRRSKLFRRGFDHELHSIQRGDVVSAVNQLLVFQNKVRSQVLPFNPTLAEALVKTAQQIIDELSGGNINPDGCLHGRFTSVLPQPNGSVQLHFVTVPRTVRILETSTNRVNWEKIGMAVDNGDGTFIFANPNALAYPKRFYRAVLLP